MTISEKVICDVCGKEPNLFSDYPAELSFYQCKPITGKHANAFIYAVYQPPPKEYQICAACWNTIMLPQLENRLKEQIHE